MSVPVAPLDVQTSPVTFVPNTPALSGTSHQIVKAPIQSTNAPLTQANANSGGSI